jgi:hypothetical protein
MQVKKSAAYLKLEASREKLIGGSEKYNKIECPTLAGVLYNYTDTRGRPCSMAFKGRAIKNTFHVYYKNEDERVRLNQVWLDKVAEIKAEAKERSTPTARALNIGDVLYSSWGYEQTNIDYYLVIALKGKSSVVIQEIAAVKKYETHSDRGTCTPDTNIKVGEPMTKRANGNRIKLNSFSGATPLEFKVINGKKKYRSHYWSSYA